MTFGEALEEFRSGNRVSRSGRRGDWAWLVLVSEAVLTVESGGPMVDVLPVGNKFTYGAHIDMCGTLRHEGRDSEEGAFAPWSPSQADILAEDWFVVDA